MSPARPADLFARLDALGIAHATVRHPPIFTVAEGADLKAAIPGVHSKNLFLKDKSGRLALVCACSETTVALNRLHRTLGFDRFSFGAPDLMLEVLGVTPGSVTLFALINDTARKVTLILDAALLAGEPISFHPLTNEATTSISRAGVAAFVRAWGGAVHVVDFSGESPVSTPGTTV